jgi:pSer/pThr/pTyr-binding forkhead associated (FHA) protein
MAQYRLMMRSGPTVGRNYPLEGEELSIGRDTSNKISINDAEVSRKHARLLWQGEGYLLEDFGSTNGTFVNGQRLSGSTMLKVGDLVALGENVALLYESDYDPDATLLSTKSKSVQAAKAAPPPPVAAPEPLPVYSGQVPAGPAPITVAPAKRSRKTLLIIIAVLLLLCICAVAAFLYFAPCSFWLNIPIVQWGACPS